MSLIPNDEDRARQAGFTQGAAMAEAENARLRADNERLLGLLRGCVKAMERDVDTRRCATSTLRALNEARAALAGAAEQPSITPEESPTK